MISVRAGTTVPIYIVLENAVVGRMIRVEIINPLTAEVLATIFPEDVPDRPGHYSDLSFLMPDLANLVALVYTYDDDDVTILTEDLVPITAKELAGTTQEQVYTDFVAIIDDSNEIVSILSDV